jgi:6-phosphogluconolactonase (cycloisomerase 2 family)
MGLKPTWLELAARRVAMGAFATAVLAGCGGGGGQAVTQPMVSMVAYATNGGSNDVSAYVINTTTGALTSVGAAVPAGTNPVAVTVEPSGRFAYVANRDSNNISAYAIDPATGALTAIGTAATGTGPSSISVPATGKFVFVSNLFDKNAGAYSINAATGALTAISADVLAGRFVTLDPLGRFVFVVNENDTVTTYALDGATGSLKLPVTTSTASHSSALGVDPTGKFAYLGNSSSHELTAYAINPTTGALTQVGTPVSGSGTPYFEPKGRFLYAASTFPTRLAYAINGATGELTATGASTSVSYTSSTDWTFEPNGKFLFVLTNYITHGIYQSFIQIQVIDPATGALTGDAGLSSAQREAWIKPVADPLGKFLYVVSSGLLGSEVRTYSIEANTGTLTQVGTVAASSHNSFTTAKLR